MATESIRFGIHPPARRVIVHLSDTHLLAANRPLAYSNALRGGRFPHTSRSAGVSTLSINLAALRPARIFAIRSVSTISNPIPTIILYGQIPGIGWRLCCVLL